MRKQLVIVGHSQAGIDVIPLLESNPGVEVVALISDDPEAIHRALKAADPKLARRFADRVSSDLDSALATPGLTAVIDADAPPELRRRMSEARGVQVTTPALAKLMFAFGPADAFGKQDLLQTLRDILDSYNLAFDRRALLDRVLQIAVSATGADRGSIMLWDPHGRVLRVEVAIGIEDELIPKIQVPSGEGVAGRAFAAQRPILINGKADRSRYQITRERDDLQSAISAPLVHGEEVIGVLNVSHARDQNVFGAEDLEFVEQLACLDARLIARAEEYHGLRRESETLRAEAQVRRLMSGGDPLATKLEEVCAFVAEAMEGSVCQLYLRDSETGALIVHSLSSGMAAVGGRERIQVGEGLLGWVAQTRENVFLSRRVGGSNVYYACFALCAGDEFVGVMVFHGAGDPVLSELLEARLAAITDALAQELDDALRAARLERESRRSAALSELFAVLGACQDSKELHGPITASASSILEAQDTVLRLRDGDTGRFRIVSWTGIGQWREAPVAALEKRLAGDAIGTRRTVRVADVESDPNLAAEAAGIGTVMIQPLVVADGHVIGTLSVLGKVPEEPLLGEHFDAADEQILQRLAEHVQVRLRDSRQPSSVAEHQDAETGLPGPRALHERLEEELARSRVLGHSFTLVQLRFVGLETTNAGADFAAHLADALRLELREFDVLARSSAEVFSVLVPEHDAEVSRLLTALNRAARRVLDQHPGAEGIELETGYANFPRDGDEVGKLITAASIPRVEVL